MKFEKLDTDLQEFLLESISLSKLRNSKKGLFKNNDFFEELSKAIELEAELFRAVLDRALIDFVDPALHKQYRQEVEEWLDLDNPDFKLTCEAAELPPLLVYKMFFLVEDLLLLQGEISNETTNKEE